VSEADARGWTGLQRLAAALLLALGTFALFAPASGHGFLNYDDDEYVTENELVAGGLTPTAAADALTSFRADNWHPVTWLSHMLDVSLYGLDPAGHHRTNVLLHALVAALLFLALASLTGHAWTSLLVAAFFAVHPLRVESVAWVAERKDLLAGLFFALALWVHARVARRPSVGGRVLLTLVFALGIMAKPMLVTLPCVLLLLDRWPLQRAEPWRALFLEKAPLFAVAAASAVLTFLAQRAGGALEPLFDVGLGARIANALQATATYLGDTLWPTRLAILYPHRAILEGPDYAAWTAPVLGAGVLLIAFSALALRLVRTMPWVLVGWLWYLGMLAPVIGLVQVGIQSHADRYTYLPCLGPVIAVAWTARALVRERPGAARAVALGALVWILALVPATRRQLAHWESSKSVMEHALAVTEDNFMAHTNLAEALERERRLDEAAGHYEEALRIRPGIAAVAYNLARLRQVQGRLDEAAAAYRAVLESVPDYVDALVNLGILSSMRGRDGEAVQLLGRVWDELRDARPEARAAAGQALAWTLATSGDDGVRDGARALVIAEECLAGARTPQLLETLAAAHAATGDFESAVRVETEALQVMPPAGHVGAEERLRLYRSGVPYLRPGR
jgi:tetratricopeptide (TPR) repeat protein